jgi:parallel beta-helix repeat protein
MYIYKLNYNASGSLISDEIITLASGNKVVSLLHHNLMDSPVIEIWTGTVRTGTQITDFTVSPNVMKPWIYDITFGASVTDGTYYATYYSEGDENDAEDINSLRKGLENIFIDATNPPAPLQPAVGDGVTVNAPAIRAMLRWARGKGGVTFYFPDGLYMLENSLEIFAHTTIVLSDRAEFRRNALYGNMIVNGIMSAENDPEYQDYSGYNGEGYITIRGGTWNSMGSTFNQSASGILLGHGKYITVHDLTILDINSNHAIEVNGCQHINIQNVTIDGFVGDDSKEAIQLDIMSSSSAFPHFGLYDNTCCDDVFIQGCTIMNYGRGIGSHSSATGVWQTNIKIFGNHFYNLVNHAVRGENWKNAVISANTMDTVGIGVEMYTANATASGTYVIADNVIKNLTRSDSNGHAIWVNGNDDIAEYVYDVTVSNNSISGGQYAGIQLEYARDSIVSGNIISGLPNQNAINIYNYCHNVTVTNNIAHDCRQGFSITYSDFCTFSFNKVYKCQLYGMVLANNCNNNDISSNYFHSNNTSNSTYSNLRMSSNCLDNNIQGNICRVGTGYPNYAISLTNTCTGNLIINNDLKGGGTLGIIDDTGAVAVTTLTNGNRTS